MKPQLRFEQKAQVLVRLWLARKIKHKEFAKELSKEILKRPVDAAIFFHRVTLP